MAPIKSLLTALVLVLALGAACQAQAIDEQKAKRIVTDYLAVALKFPQGYKAIAWSKLVAHPYGGAYQCSIRHRYSFTLGFDKAGREIKAVADQVFSIDYNGYVVGAESLRPSATHPRTNPWRP
ncbi:hypothetical protein Deba_2653 [Desulfarculus baarsii DSM 2075]|uniref:Lipoprotein n=1 Tax=Desulfarculus baarsii (strain ATCC 33931 / DSM 2075 / LMG 7858 / VKM B-1802 / 2st14) TaxID=644282 RepID=E1QKB4_DESB2|nr:hypothetical protein [Desulfarculus baarsii]ADK86007.1 hypothetical protein Deba_2653 [Desulfarculus baarsii DSM 2075]